MQLPVRGSKRDAKLSIFYRTMVHSYLNHMFRIITRFRNRFVIRNNSHATMAPKPKNEVPTVPNYVDKDLLLGKISALDAQFKTGKHDPNWVSFGYDETDQFLDTWKYRFCLFFGYSFALVGMIFVVAYFPDPKNYDWAYREALFEIARREKHGLPLIDKNLIPVERIVLPNEDQIGDTRIII